MKRMITLFFILGIAIVFGGCATNGYGPYYGSGFSRHQRALAGTAMGAAGGALLGGAMTHDGDGALIGGLLGGAAGGLVGHSMDRAQRPPGYYQGGGQQYYGGGYPPAYYGGERRHRRHDDD